MLAEVCLKSQYLEKMKRYVFAPFSVGDIAKGMVHQAKFALMRRGKTEIYTPDGSGLDDLLLESESGERIVLENVIISVRLRCKLSESRVEGLDGTLKENCGERDSEFQVNFCCMNVNTTDGRESLYEKVSDVLNYLRENVYFSVANDYLNRQGVMNCVFVEYKVGENVYENYLPLSIRFKADEDSGLLECI